VETCGDADKFSLGGGIRLSQGTQANGLVSDIDMPAIRSMKLVTGFMIIAILLLALFVRPWWEKEETEVYSAILQLCFTGPSGTYHLIQRETRPLTRSGITSFQSSRLGLEWSIRANYFFKNLIGRDIPTTIQSSKPIIYV
jgi:hypothetical protein